VKQRALAREVALKLLFARELGGAPTAEEVLEQSEAQTALDGPDELFMRELVEGVSGNQAALDEIIEAHAQGWALTRIAKVDLLILRLAVFELRYRLDIPTGATINEAVELAKRFGEEKSYRFVNGILGAVARAAPQIPDSRPQIPD